MNDYNKGYLDGFNKFKEVIKQEITFLENEKICEYDPRYEKNMNLLPLSKWGRAISEQEAKIKTLKKILNKNE